STSSQRVLLVLDAQAGVLSDPPRGVPAAPALRPTLARILATARAARPPPLIVHVRNTGDSGDIDEPGTAGWQLVFEPRVRPAAGGGAEEQEGEQPDEIVLDKRKNNAFAGTKLGELVPPDAEIVIVGLQSDFSVRATCSAALGRGNSVLLIRGAHATYDRLEVLYGGGTTPASQISREIEGELEEAGVHLLEVGEVGAIWEGR
ncbi:Isochorismatase-like protein, partial [Mycena galericulata]